MTNRPEIELRDACLEVVEASGAARVAISLERLDQSFEFEIEGSAVFHSASTMKVPVMAEAFRQVDQGALSLDDKLEIQNLFASALDGSPFSTLREDDGDQQLYQKLGTRVDVEELIERMIVRSSNLATNILLHRLGASNIQALLDDLGCGAFRVRRGVEDGKAYRAGLVNQATASSYRRLLALIAKGAVHPRSSRLASCRTMVEVLKRQEQLRGVPAGLPEAEWVANKPGHLDALFHDGAIVKGRGDLLFVLVVFTEGAAWEAGAAVARDVAEKVWRVFSHLN